MCGIAGIFSTRDSSTAAAAAMNDAFRHRGPDDTGIARLTSGSGSPCGAFGHRRLAIIDLSMAGHQPMFSPGGATGLTYNGEIYNFLELRSELEREGVAFRSSCDTEVILLGWALHGPAFLAKLRGMFALAIWDSERETGYLVRDTFGIKPLYVAERNGEILFASEVRALLATGLVPRVLSNDAVQSYLATGSVTEPLTIIEGITAVPPGCVVEVAREGERFVMRPPMRFVPANAPAEERSVGSHTARIREALRESVRYHLVADVPVAVFLSGGIDSTAVAGLASEVSDTRIESFTVIFDEAEFSEAAPARASARRFNTTHHEILLSGVDLLNALPDVFKAMDQPSLDGLNTFVVSRAVHSFGLKVVMSGLGGDELFGGYPSFQRARYAAPLWKLPRALRRLGAAGTGAFDDNRASRMSALLRDDDPAHAAYVASRTLFGERQVARLSGSHGRMAAGRRAVEGEMRDLTLMQQVSHYELTGYMRNTLLRDSDVFSMAHGLELRVPLVDVEVARVAREAASALELRRGEIKPMLVEAVRDLLSPEIIAQPKRGFTLPFEKWMRSELFAEVDEVLSRGAAASVGLNAGEVARVWQAFQRRQGGVNWSRPWALYTLMRWARVNGVSTGALPESVRVFTA